MRKTQKNTLHRVDVREPLEKLSLLNTKKTGVPAVDARKTGTKAKVTRPGRWM